jgi:oligo-1,6-glucosidase
MRGTPFYYQGDELGMVNPRFNSIDEYQDLETETNTLI